MIQVGNVDRNNLIFDSCFFKKDGNFMTVGSWPVVQVNHDLPPIALTPLNSIHSPAIAITKARLPRIQSSIVFVSIILRLYPQHLSIVVVLMLLWPKDCWSRERSHPAAKVWVAWAWRSQWQLASGLIPAARAAALTIWWTRVRSRGLWR